MKKKLTLAWVRNSHAYKQFLLAMRLTIFLIVFSVAAVIANTGHSQEAKITLQLKNATLSDVLNAIENNSSYYFMLNNKLIDLSKKIDIDVQDKMISEILTLLSEKAGIKYKIYDRQIVLSPGDQSLSDFSVSQQQKSISGKVTDSSGGSLPGVSVVVKGTTIGVITDMDGKYTLTNIPEDATLQFSFVGMKTQEIVIGNKTTINITLIEETVGIEEVVAVGYGVQKKVNLTGAVSAVAGEEMTKRPVINASTMLQGQVPGLRVVQGSGQPGSENTSFRIRGQGTYSSAGSNPLILINGVPGSIDNLDPNIIESVSVLKDAASASIYGARAANGVVLVTTKKGSSNSTISATYTTNLSIHTPTKMLDIVTNSVDYMELLNQAKKNSGKPGLYSQEVIDLYRNNKGSYLYPNFDWLGYMFNPAFVQNHNLSINGASDKSTYNISMSYADQPGTMRGFNYKKYNFSVNLTSDITKWMKIGTFITAKYGDRKEPRTGQQDAFLATMSQAPTYMPWLPDDGSGVKRYTMIAYDGVEESNKNMPALIANGINTTNRDYDINGQAFVELNLFKGFSWYAKMAGRIYSNKMKDWSGCQVPLYNYRTSDFMMNLDLGGGFIRGLQVKDDRTLFTNFYSYFKYEAPFANTNHHLSTMVGYDQEKQLYEYIWAKRRNYDFNLYELAAGSNSDMENDGDSEDWSLMSGFFRLNYDYKDKYLLEVNARYDGTSRIAKENRWGLFPSLSLAWRITEERFMKNLHLDWLDNVKLRGSWGQLGNQNIGLYPYQALVSLTDSYSFDNSSLTQGVAQTDYAYRNIKWETTTITDLGVELQLLKKLNLTIDWYKKSTTGILRSAQVSSFIGLNAPTINNGAMDNTGFELSVGWKDMIRRGLFNGLKYNLDAYIDHSKNELVKFGAKEIGSNSILMEGIPYNSYYLLDAIGIFADQTEINNSPKQFSDTTRPGDIKYRDVSGPDGTPDGKIDNNDRIVMDGRFPSLDYSFAGNASWKGFDFSFLFQGVAGRKTYINSGWGITPFVQGSAPTKDYLKGMWTEENPNGAKFPRLYYGDMGGGGRNTRASDFYLMDASYLRLKNISLGYTFPASLTRKIEIDRLRVFFSGDNLLTITDYMGLDPERSGDGTFVTYPQNKIFSFGLNVEF